MTKWNVPCQGHIYYIHKCRTPFLWQCLSEPICILTKYKNKYITTHLINFSHKPTNYIYSIQQPQIHEPFTLLPIQPLSLHRTPVKQPIYANLRMSLTVSQKTGRRICSWSLNRSPWFTWNIVDNSSSRRSSSSSSSLSLSLELNRRCTVQSCKFGRTRCWYFLPPFFSILFGWRCETEIDMHTITRNIYTSPATAASATVKHCTSGGCWVQYYLCGP